MGSDAGEGDGPLGHAMQRLKLFRLAEANATLVEVRALLDDIRPLTDEARGLQRQLRMLQAVGHDRDGMLLMAEDYRLARQRFEGVAERIQAKVERMEGLGCKVRSVQLGVVDFPGLYEGKPVLFCWRQGEPEISYYHMWGEGYAARRRLFGQN